MAPESVIIPEKIYFKIGEVCDILGVQPHVLRYWETEFPMLSPQKNKSGQRSYRRRDVEMALKIKQLLYNEMFTIAGARKKLQSDSRGRAGKTEVAHTPQAATTQSSNNGPSGEIRAPMLFDTSPEPSYEQPRDVPNAPVLSAADANYRDTLRNVAGQLLELREILKSPRP